MKRLLLSAVLVLACSNAFAATTCKEMEYAELKDMAKDKLIEKYCHSKKMQSFDIQLLDETRRVPSAFNREQKKKYQADVDSCYKLLEKIENAYEAKFSEKIPACK